MEGYLYILKSDRNGRYYIGSTSDLERRVKEHNRGQTKSTAKLAPWKLMFSKLFPDVIVAMQFERRLKKMKSRKIIEKIILEQEIYMGQ
jgi:putative endonuclease